MGVIRSHTCSDGRRRNSSLSVPEAVREVSRLPKLLRITGFVGELSSSDVQRMPCLPITAMGKKLGKAIALVGHG